MTEAINPAPWPALYQPIDCPMIPARNDPAIQSLIFVEIYWIKSILFRVESFS